MLLRDCYYRTAQDPSTLTIPVQLYRRPPSQASQHRHLLASSSLYARTDHNPRHPHPIVSYRIVRARLTLALARDLRDMPRGRRSAPSFTSSLTIDMNYDSDTRITTTTPSQAKDNRQTDRQTGGERSREEEQSRNEEEKKKEKKTYEDPSR